MITENPNEKQKKTKVAELVKFLDSEQEPKSTPKQEVPTRDIKDLKNEAIVLCLKIIRGEDCFEELYTILKDIV
jgi:hypothetical protein